MEHHYKEPNLGFGVTSAIWDWVFGESLVRARGRSQTGIDACAPHCSSGTEFVSKPKNKAGVASR
jgi:sterol desaturase/sphingolipid hydroxylase (fatty acid hydroxylase superfamily)